MHHTRKGRHHIYQQRQAAFQTCITARLPFSITFPTIVIVPPHRRYATLLSHHISYPYQLATMSNSNDNPEDWVDTSGSSQPEDDNGQGYGAPRRISCSQSSIHGRLNLTHMFRLLFDRSCSSADANTAGSSAEGKKPFPRRSTEEIERDAYVFPSPFIL